MIFLRMDLPHECSTGHHVDYLRQKDTIVKEEEDKEEEEEEVGPTYHNAYSSTRMDSDGKNDLFACSGRLC